MERTAEAEPRKQPALSFSAESNPCIMFLDLDRELEEADQAGLLGYLRSGFQIAKIRKNGDSTSKSRPEGLQEGIHVVSIEEALDYAKDSWIVVSESAYLEKSPDNEGLLGKAGLLVKQEQDRAEMKRIVIFSSKTQTDNRFAHAQVTHFGQLFAKTILLSAVQKKPSIWFKSLTFLRYHSDLIANHSIFQDAYPFYFNPAFCDSAYFRVTTNTGFSLLSEHISNFPLQGLKISAETFSRDSKGVTLVVASSSEQNSSTTEQVWVDMADQNTRPPFFSWIKPPAQQSTSRDPKDTSSDSVNRDTLDGYFVSLGKPVPALFDSFVLGQTVLTNIRDISWGQSHQKTGSDPKPTATPPKPDPEANRPSDTAERHEDPDPSRSLPAQQALNPSRLSSRFLTKMGNLRKKQVVKMIPATTTQIDETILLLAEHVRRVHGLDASHGLRILFFLDKHEVESGSSQARMTVIGVSGLFSSTWGGLSPPDIASLHVVMIDTIKVTLHKSQKSATSKQV